MFANLPDLIGEMAQDWIGLTVLWTFKSWAILGVAASLALLLGRAPAATRHRIWAVGLIGVLLIPVLEHAMPKWRAIPMGAAYVGGRVPDVEPAATPSEVIAEPLGAYVEPVAAGIGSSGREAVRHDAAEPSGVWSSEAVASHEHPPEPPSSGLGPARGQRGFSAAAILFVVWLAGVLGWLAFVGAGVWRADRVFQRARRAPPQVRALVHVLRSELGISRPVIVRCSREIPVPATWGMLRPKIVLPLPALAWSRERLRHVLLHELAHVRRYDWPIRLLAEATRALRWFDPAVWMAVRWLAVEQERASDDQVIASGARPSTYARDLLEVAHPFWRPGIAEAVVPLTRTSRLGRRLAALLDSRRQRSSNRARASAATVTALTLTLPLAALAPRAPEPAAAPGAESREAPVQDSGGTVAEADRDSDPPTIVTSELLFGAPEPRAPSVRRGASGAAIGPSSVAGRSFAAVEQAVEVCAFRTGGRHSSSVNAHDDAWEIRWSTDDCSVEIDLEGRIEFTGDDGAIASMEPGASLEIEERLGRTRRRLLAESDRSGELTYRYWLDGDERPFDEEARAWLASLLPELFRHTTIQAEERVRRILARSGPQGVLEEVERIDSDHVAVRYLALLMDQADLDPTEVNGVLRVAAGRLDSDHYSAEVLGAVARRWGIRPEYQASYVAAIRNLDSDHYRHETIVALLERDDVTSASLRQILEEASRMDSDHYAASILSRVARRGRLEGDDRAAFVRALSRIESDHYLHEVLTAFITTGDPLSEAELANLLELTSSIDSDHYRTSILGRLAEEPALHGVAITTFLESARGIESDHYLAETAGAILARADLGDDQVDLVLDIAESIEGDHHRAELLITLADAYPLSGEARSRYRVLAEEIGSRHYRDRALAVLVRGEI